MTWEKTNEKDKFKKEETKVEVTYITIKEINTRIQVKNKRKAELINKKKMLKSMIDNYTTSISDLEKLKEDLQKLEE